MGSCPDTDIDPSTFYQCDLHKFCGEKFLARCVA